MTFFDHPPLYDLLLLAGMAVAIGLSVHRKDWRTAAFGVVFALLLIATVVYAGWRTYELWQQNFLGGCWSDYKHGRPERAECAERREEWMR